jgi:hypothetical protein
MDECQSANSKRRKDLQGTWQEASGDSRKIVVEFLL